MATRKSRPSKSASGSAAESEESGELAKRIELWSKANGEYAHAETMCQLLARGVHRGKRAVRRTKT
jgi:hypothetical protein